MTENQQKNGLKSPPSTKRTQPMAASAASDSAVGSVSASLAPKHNAFVIAAATSTATSVASTAAAEENSMTNKKISNTETVPETAEKKEYRDLPATTSAVDDSASAAAPPPPSDSSMIVNGDDSKKNDNSDNQSSLLSAPSTEVGEASVNPQKNDARDDGGASSLPTDPKAEEISTTNATTTTPSETLALPPLASIQSVAVEASAATNDLTSTSNAAAPIPTPTTTTTTANGTAGAASTVAQTKSSGGQRSNSKNNVQQPEKHPTKRGYFKVAGEWLHWKTIEKMEKEKKKQERLAKMMNTLHGKMKQSLSHKFGVEYKYLGMEISKDNQKQSSLSVSETEGGSEEASAGRRKGGGKPPKKSKSKNSKSGEAGGGSGSSRGEAYKGSIQSIQDGVLDIYSYHRGREGMEPRDPESGELLCAQAVTDTNHDWDAPKMVVNIVIQFPLDDDDEDDGPVDNTKEGEEKVGEDNQDEIDAATTSLNNSTRLYYRETIDWDLSNTSTQSPMDFAGDVAKEFGLSFGQMMDLATSIQKQIDGFVQQQFTYSAPLANKDPTGTDRRFIGPTLHTHRYGQAVSDLDGGMAIDRRSLIQQGSDARSTASGSTGRRKSYERHDDGGAGDEFFEELEEEVRKEVLDRARSASIQAIQASCPLGQPVGKMDRIEDTQCHICHKKYKVCYRFACGMISHVYCLMHCKVRW